MCLDQFNRSLEPVEAHLQMAHLQGARQGRFLEGYDSKMRAMKGEAEERLLMEITKLLEEQNFSLLG